MNFSLNNKLLSLTLIRVNAWISYLRKEVNYYIKNCIHYMKPLLESNLLYFVTRFYKNLAKPVGNFSCLHVFNIFPACASFPSNENTGQNTKSGMYKRLGPLLLLCLEPPPPHTSPPYLPPLPCPPNTNVQRELRSTTDYFSYESLYQSYSNW